MRAFDTTAPSAGTSRQANIRGLRIVTTCNNGGAYVDLVDSTGNDGALYWDYATTTWGDVQGTSTKLDQGYVPNGQGARFWISSYGLYRTIDARMEGDFIFKGASETITIAMHASELDGRVGCGAGADVGGTASYAPTVKGIAPSP